MKINYIQIFRIIGCLFGIYYLLFILVLLSSFYSSRVINITNYYESEFDVTRKSFNSLEHFNNLNSNLIESISLNSYGSTFETNASGKFPNFVNVLDYGAIGDGINDDTLNIQEAINQNSIVFFPTGNYRITNKLIIPSATHLIGEGCNSRLGYDATKSSLLQISSSNVVLDNLSLHSLDKTNPKDVSKGLILIDSNINNIKITNCTIGYIRQRIGDDFGYAIHVDGKCIENLHVIGNLFECVEGVDDNAIGGDGTVGFIFIEQNDVKQFNKGVSGIISRNRFSNTRTIPQTTLRSDADAIRLYNKWAWETDNFTTPKKINSYDIIISENFFESIQHICIKASGIGGLTVTNNYVDNTHTDTYPQFLNTFGTKGEKDFQIGFEFRGGSFICENNTIKTQSSGIIATGAIGITGL